MAVGKLYYKPVVDFEKVSTDNAKESFRILDPSSSNELPRAALKEENGGGEVNRTMVLLPAFFFSLHAICNTLAASRRLM